MTIGYCTVDDVRRALRQAELPGDAQQDKDILIDAVAATAEWMEKEYSIHWYVPDGITEDDEELIPSAAITRDDEHDIPTHGAFVDGAYDDERFQYSANSDALLESDPRHDRPRRQELRRDPKEEIRLTFGDLEDDTVPAYTRIRLDRRYVKAVNELSVVNADGGFDDWVSSTDYDGGVGNTNRGKDYWVRINNDGVTELYLNVHSMDDDIASLSKAVYVDIDHGHEGLPRNVRRAAAFWAGADLVEEAVIEIPQNATVYNIETKAEEMRSQAEKLMEVYR